MDREKMRFISAVLMLVTAFIELLKCVLWVCFAIIYSYFSNLIVFNTPTIKIDEGV